MNTPIINMVRNNGEGINSVIKKYELNSLVILLTFFFTFSLYYSNTYAQYFGRNKVKYEDFKFKVLTTQHFKLYFYPKESEAVYDAAYMLERWEDRQSQLLGDILPANQPIILYANHADFQQTNVTRNLIPQGTGGFTEPLQNRIVLPFGVLNADNNHVLGHELVHAFQYETSRKSGKGARGLNAFPLWFIEGMAEYLSIGSQDEHTAMWMRDAILNDDLPTIDEVASDYKYFPYRYGHAIWSYICGKYGDQILTELFANIMTNGWLVGFENTFGYGLDSLSERWRESTKHNFIPQLSKRDKPSATGKPLLTGGEGMNLSPVISPDGKYIAFLSRQELFTLALYLAEASTGRIIKQLISSETNEHFDALRFMNSAGTWSPDSKKFAFTVFDDGDNAVSILNVDNLEVEKTIHLNGILEITHLNWSPDGNKIVLTGSKGDYSNLYILDLDTGDYTQLTNDKYSDLQPVWSPDGRKIAYSTDRGEETNLDRYKFGSLNIRILDVESGEAEMIKIGEGIKHINPHFSGDGKNLFFISNPDGFSNIYRYNFDEDKFYRITNIATGITGITKTSSAMSVSTETGQIVFSVFDNTEHKIHSLNSSETEGTEFNYFNKDQYLAGISLPPVSTALSGLVENYLSNYEIVDTDEREMPIADYDPSLSLILAGNTSIGVAVSGYGTGIGGAVSLLFSDMLGNHLLGVTAIANGSYKDIGGQVVYQNLENRYNYGAAIAHIPYLTGFVSSAIVPVEVNGQSVLAQEIEFFRQRTYVDRLDLMGEYPISTNRRFELSVGYSRISYDLEVQRIITDLNGFVISSETEDLDSPSGLNLFRTSAAYVGDYSYFGFTSPVDGSRYRFGVEPTFGSLQFLSAIGDYRQYIFFRPITFGFRLLHIGRYFGDSESNRLSPLTIGYDTYVRGYDINSINVSEFSFAGDPNQSGNLKSLVGSKIGVFNFEVRLPLIGNEQFGLINLPFLPIELVGFFDSGIAWTNEEPPVFKFAETTTERVPVFSTGVATRINVLGYVVAQVFYAYPFQRPGQGGQFGFLIAPGW